MSKFEEYVLVVGGFQGSVLWLLLSFDARLNTASRILGAICLLMASAFLMPFLELVQSGPLQWLLGWIFYLPAAGGALAYLYCRSALLGRPLARPDVLFFLPLLLCYLLAADLLVGDPAALNAWIRGGPAPDWRLPASEYLLFAQAFGYAAATVAMIGRYRRAARTTLADFNPAIFRWMLVLQVLTLAIWSLNALPALTSASVVFTQIANLLMVFMVYLIAITQWRLPELFRIPELAAEQAADAAGPGDAPQAADGELDPDLRARLHASIVTEMEQRQL
ncbi:MAG: hypothetical protein V2J24_20010, partial [Pseudomonadales bacterium]|nr:hypothetical protein [Pseudomonadales bacterium]